MIYGVVLVDGQLFMIDELLIIFTFVLMKRKTMLKQELVPCVKFQSSMVFCHFSWTMRRLSSYGVWTREIFSCGSLLSR